MLAPLVRGSPTWRRGWHVRRSREDIASSAGHYIIWLTSSTPVVPTGHSARCTTTSSLSAVPAQAGLYEIIRDRYERKSIILTSNRAPEEWAEVFGNSLLASAALDRLTHHSHFIEMMGESYRQRQRRLDTGGLITGEKEVRQQNTSEEKGGDM